MPKAQPSPNWTDRGCTACTLSAQRTQIVVASPGTPGNLLAIGEAPGADEDIQGVGFVGDAGRILDRLLAAEGIVRTNYGRANICRCRPPDNRKPRAPEAKACLPFLANFILATRPKVLLLVGRTATEKVMGTGTLTKHIEQANANPFNNFSRANKALRQGLGPLLSQQGGLLCVPMPHTSLRALNRNTPNGVKWGQVAPRQVAYAVSLLNASP